jgi:putative ABC transport system permease protein
MLMDRLWMDVRFATRSLAKRPFMSLTVIATLALGIGANAAVFNIIDALVLHPYTLRDVDRIVMPVQTAPNENDKRESVSPANFLDWRRDTARGDTIRNLAAFDWWEANLMGRDEPEYAMGFRVSASFFAAMGVSPALGRGFLPEEEVAGRDRKVVLSDGLWRRRFGADPSILGTSILVDGAPADVVGIMPPKFDFPLSAEVWAPLAFDPKVAPSRTNSHLTVIGRLADGKTVADAQAEMSVLAARLQHDFPTENKDRQIIVYTLASGMRDLGLNAVLALWEVAAVFVLLIACANIANLLLARGAERGREIAVRLALGSSRGRITREALLESVILAVIAVPVALLLGTTFVRVIQSFMPARIVKFVAGWNQLGLDTRMVAMTAVLGVAAALICGSLPALQLSRGGLAGALKSDGRTGSGPARHRLRRALVVAEVALSLPLLVCALLSVRSVTTYLTGWQGYDPTGLLTLKLVLPEARYADADSRRRFAERAAEALATAPGVTGVAAANVLPASDSNSSRRFEIAGHPVPEGTLPPSVDYRAVTASFFDVLRQPMVAGRAITSADQAGTMPVVVVSQSMAKKFWPDGNAIGSRIRIGSEPWMTVIGVCGDYIHDWFDARNRPTMYASLLQSPTSRLMFAVRTNGDPAALASDVRRAIRSVDSAQPMFDVMPMPRMLAGVMATFGVLALILAMVGLYAVMSYLIAQRVREIGVRVALGASSRDVTRLALGQAARLTAIGIVIGVAAAIALGRVMEAGLLGVVSSDLRSPFAIALLLATTALAASYLPARRAAAVDPMVALRTE